MTHFRCKYFIQTLSTIQSQHFCHLTDHQLFNRESTFGFYWLRRNVTGVYTWCCANSGPINQPIISSPNNNNINKHEPEQMCGLWTVWRVIGERLNSELTPRPSQGNALWSAPALIDPSDIFSVSELWVASLVFASRPQIPCEGWSHKN